MERSSSICPTTGLNKGAWTPEEDTKLTDYVNQYGVPIRTWSQVPAKAGLSRCRKSCRFRWMNYLRPGIKRGNYTKEEEDVIIYLHTQLDFGWAAIADWLPGRTDCDIKNHWYTKLNKNAKPPIKEKRKPERARSNKRGRVDTNNTTVILESSALSLVSPTKTFPPLSTRNSEGSTSSAVPPSKDKDVWLLEEAIVDWDNPSENPDDLDDSSLFTNNTSSLLQGWDFPIENAQELVEPEFSLLTSRVILRRKTSKFTSQVILGTSEDQGIDDNSQVIFQGSHDPPVSPTLSSYFSEKAQELVHPEFSLLTPATPTQFIRQGIYTVVTSPSSYAPRVPPTLLSLMNIAQFSSLISRRQIFRHISPDEFSELTSQEEFSEEEIFNFTSPNEISEFTSPEKFSCFTYLNSLVSLLQNSLNSLVSLLKFKKCN